ncbi:hypothetical protein QCD79_18450, partial [Pseudomonas quasicaspiana]|nr:hypothetical protein [Pseudomonas quasicaspiana]
SGVFVCAFFHAQLSDLAYFSVEVAPVSKAPGCIVANIGPVGAAEGCDRGVSGEMLRSLRQLLQKMHFNPTVFAVNSVVLSAR